MSQKLAGKVAVVTGASKGIGAGIAKALADEGAAVVVNYSSSKQGADRVVADISGRGGKAIAVQGDVSKQADIERLFSEAKKAFGRIDILVNNAGFYEFAPLEEVTEKHHQHRVDREYPAGAKLHALRGEQGRSRRDHGRAGEGARPAKDPGERDQPGDDRDRGDTCHWIRRKRLPDDGRDASTARTCGATRRYRAGGGVPGVVGFQIHDRGDPRGIGWPEIARRDEPQGTVASAGPGQPSWTVAPGNLNPAVRRRRPRA